MKKSYWMTAILILSLILFYLPAEASRLLVPPTPSSFYGSALVNGYSIPLGTEVSAWINGVKYAFTPSIEYNGLSVYSMDVPGDDPETFDIKEGGVAGDIVTFQIGGVTANPTAPWRSGVNFPLNLTVTPATVFVDGSYNSGTGGWGVDHVASIQSAIDFVAAGGTVQVTTGSYPESLTVTKNLILLGVGLPTINPPSGDALQCITGNLTIKGFNIQASGVAFNVGVSCNLMGYANNISGFTLGVTNSGGAFIGRHNWWGSKHPTTVNNIDAEIHRLGSPVVTWSEGAGAATLGAARMTGITGATGTAVIVNHGNDAPFVTPTQTMCSDYFDFFTIAGTGNWDLSLPVNTGPVGCAATYASKKVAYVPSIAACTNPAGCWIAYPSDFIRTDPGDILSMLSVPSAALEGTPFVAGSTTGTGPTALNLISLKATSGGKPAYGLIVFSLLLTLGLALIAARKWLHIHQPG